jgi:hypothetical protein
MSEFRVFPGRSLARQSARTVAVRYGRTAFRSRDRKEADFELMLFPRHQEARDSSRPLLEASRSAEMSLGAAD